MSTRLIEKGGFMLSKEGVENLYKAINSDNKKSIKKIEIIKNDYSFEKGLNQFAKRILTSYRKKVKNFDYLFFKSYIKNSLSSILTL